MTEDGPRTHIRVDVFDGGAHSAWWTSRSKTDPFNQEEASHLARKIGQAVEGVFQQATLF